MKGKKTSGGINVGGEKLGQPDGRLKKVAPRYELSSQQLRYVMRSGSRHTP